jgi:hypothetical protein
MGVRIAAAAAAEATKLPACRQLEYLRPCTYPQNSTVENGVCCMIEKSKEARKNARRVAAQHCAAQQNTTYQHTRQTWMAVE